jgi:tetratricopeptide (TPR) repeat protein
VSALLLAQRFRVGYCNIVCNAVPLLYAGAKLTGGIGAAEPASWIDRTDQSLHTFGELGWDEPGLSRGFHLYTAQPVNGSGTVVASVGRIAYPSGQPLPDLEQYAKLIESVKSAADLLQKASLNADENAQLRAHLETALSINSRDHTALRLAADFYERYNDHKTAAGLLASLTEVDPRNGALWNEFAHQYFAGNNMEAAEKALGRGRALKAVSAVAAAELARIHLARHDAVGALPLLDESLRLDDKNQELWFLRADVCRTLKDWKCEAESLDRGISLGGDQAGGDQAGGDQTAHRTTLVRLYLDHGSAAQASAQADVIIQSLPADPGVRATWAGYLEELKRPADALQMWRQTIELDKSREDAHYAVARLLLDKGDLPRALEASETGLIAAPRSARLQLAKAAALERQGNLYAARASVRHVVKITNKA